MPSRSWAVVRKVCAASRTLGAVALGEAFFDKRGGVAESDGGVSREEAEARAFAWCIVEWLNRGPIRSVGGPLLREAEPVERQPYELPAMILSVRARLIRCFFGDIIISAVPTTSADNSASR
jgi:hypothetical protein